MRWLIGQSCTVKLRFQAWEKYSLVTYKNENIPRVDSICYKVATRFGYCASLRNSTGELPAMYDPG